MRDEVVSENRCWNAPWVNVSSQGKTRKYASSSAIAPMVKIRRRTRRLLVWETASATTAIAIENEPPRENVSSVCTIMIDPMTATTMPSIPTIQLISEAKISPFEPKEATEKPCCELSALPA